MFIYKQTRFSSFKKIDILKKLKLVSVYKEISSFELPNVQIINNRDNCRYCNTKFNCIMSVNRHEKICSQKQITTINNTTTNINSNNNTINNK